MNKREFMALSGAAALAPLAAGLPTAQAAEEGHDYFELRQYQLDTDAQKQGFDAFMQGAMIPALNRLGVKPVGVFYPDDPKQPGFSPAYVLLRHGSLEACATLTQKLFADKAYLKEGAAFLNAPASAPAYKRLESSFFAAFTGMPKLETPVTAEGRVFQLRIYESPSVKTGQKKIEMFNIGEIKVFRETGLHPVFFGEALMGAKLPNLTYMLGFESRDEQKKNWRTFVNSDGWKKLKAIPEYADKEILCGITNLPLKPAEYSQI